MGAHEKGSLSRLSTSVGDQEYINRECSFSTHDVTCSPTLQELKTVAKSDTAWMVMTANGTAETNEEATVHITDLDKFLCAKLADVSLTMLSLGMLCGTMGYSYFWKTGKQRSLTKDGITRECRSENHVRVVAVTGHHSNPANAGEDPLPDWLQPFTEGSVEEHLRLNGSTQDAEPEVPPLAQRPNAKPTSIIVLRTELSTLSHHWLGSRFL